MYTHLFSYHTCVRDLVHQNEENDWIRLIPDPAELLLDSNDPDPDLMQLAWKFGKRKEKEKKRHLDGA